MEKMYTSLLINREINNKTGEIWTINDVPNTWRAKTEALVIESGYYIGEDGTAYPNSVPDEE